MKRQCLCIDIKNVHKPIFALSENYLPVRHHRVSLPLAYSRYFKYL